MNKLQRQVNKVFTEAFGTTPLTQGLEDIQGECDELCRFTTMANLKEEMGDLLATTIQRATECGWTMEELVEATLAKIERRKLQYKSTGRKIKVAILGGAFDPVTMGHIQIAQYVLNTSRTFDEVWLMPCYRHMYDKQMTDCTHRLEMVKLACQIDGRIKSFDYEIKNRLAGETYNMFKRLLDETFAKDKYDFSFIIGMDNANTFDSWVNYQHLERLARFVIVPRKGVQPDPNVKWYYNRPHIFLGVPDNSIMEVSSTEVRHNLKRGLPVDNLLDPQVESYIRVHRLYGVRAPRGR